MDRRAFKSVSTVVQSSWLVCGRWFSGPNTETLILLQIFARCEEETQFPHLRQAFFNPKVNKARPSFSVHFYCIDLIQKWAATHFSLRMEPCCTFLQKFMPAPHSKAEDSSLFSLRQQCTCTSKALQCLVHVREHLRHALRLKKWEGSSPFTSTEPLLSPHG